MTKNKTKKYNNMSFISEEVVILVVLGRYSDVHNVVEELSSGCIELYGAESK